MSRDITMVGRGGFEPPKAMPTGLQPVPFGHSGTDPQDRRIPTRTADPANSYR